MNADDIFAWGQEIEVFIAENWEKVLLKNQAKLQDAYERAGDSAYGTYLDLLFRPVRKQLKVAGLRAKPPLPGEFNISREWGVPEGNDEQRWMWSTVLGADTKPIGTLVTVIYHDHTQFRLPRAPKLIALAETGKEAVVEALSQRSEQFKNALEFTVEYALYLKSLENAKVD